MNPQQQPNQPQTPFVPPQQAPIQPVVTEEPKKSHKKLALSFLIVPTTLFILSLIFGLIATQISDGSVQDGELFAQTSPVKQILSVLAFAFGGIGFLTWLPGLIVGIILIAKKK